MNGHGRRAFLVWLTRGSLAAGAALAIGQIARFFSFEPVAEAPSRVTIDRPEAYLPGTLTYVPAARAYIGRDREGWYAVDAVCTHLGCLVKPNPDEGFICPCHGSSYAAGGQVQTGPAGAPLRHLALTLGQDGALAVDRARPVTPATRLSAPA